MPRDVREENGARENFGRRFFLAADDAERKGRPHLLVVAQLDFGQHGLLGENVLGQIEFQLDSGEHDARKHAGNQNSGEQAGQNQEQQIVAGVDGGENQNENRRRGR